MKFLKLFFIFFLLIIPGTCFSYYTIIFYAYDNNKSLVEFHTDDPEYTSTKMLFEYNYEKMKDYKKNNAVEVDLIQLSRLNTDYSLLHSCRSQFKCETNKSKYYEAYKLVSHWTPPANKKQYLSIYFAASIASFLDLDIGEEKKWESIGKKSGLAYGFIEYLQKNNKYYYKIIFHVNKEKNNSKNTTADPGHAFVEFKTDDPGMIKYNNVPGFYTDDYLTGELKDDTDKIKSAEYHSEYRVEKNKFKSAYNFAINWKPVKNVPVNSASYIFDIAGKAGITLKKYTTLADFINYLVENNKPDNETDDAYYSITFHAYDEMTELPYDDKPSIAGHAFIQFQTDDLNLISNPNLYTNLCKNPDITMENDIQQYNNMTRGFYPSKTDGIVEFEYKNKNEYIPNLLDELKSFEHQVTKEQFIIAINESQVLSSKFKDKKYSLIDNPGKIYVDKIAKAANIKTPNIPENSQINSNNYFYKIIFHEEHHLYYHNYPIRYYVEFDTDDPDLDKINMYAVLNLKFKGEIRDDSEKLTVSEKSFRYNLTKDRFINAYKKYLSVKCEKEYYKILENDCIYFASNIAEKTGLKIKERKLLNSDKESYFRTVSFIDHLNENNTSSKDYNYSVFFYTTGKNNENAFIEIHTDDPEMSIKYDNKIIYYDSKNGPDIAYAGINRKDANYCFRKKLDQSSIISLHYLALFWKEAQRLNPINSISYFEDIAESLDLKTDNWLSRFTDTPGNTTTTTISGKYTYTLAFYAYGKEGTGNTVVQFYTDDPSYDLFSKKPLNYILEFQNTYGFPDVKDFKGKMPETEISSSYKVNKSQFDLAMNASLIWGFLKDFSQYDTVSFAYDIAKAADINVGSRKDWKTDKDHNTIAEGFIKYLQENN